METRHCIYCSGVKSVDGFSEEHIIPQFMGGSSDCSEAVTHDVCKQCNSLFGRHVDAAVAKGFFQNSIERNAWESCFDYDSQAGNVFPLIYFGKNQDLALVNGQEVEVWLAPDGGTAWHIHDNHGDDFASFAGGDPVRRRREKSGRVYSFLASENLYWFLSNMKSVKAHFDREPIFLGTDADFETQFVKGRLKGKFCQKDSEALAERDAIRAILDRRAPLANRLSMDTLFDVRFLAKLAIGFGHAIFGEEYRELKHTIHLRNLLWTRRSNLDVAQLKIPMKTYFGDLQDFSLKPLSVFPGFVFLLNKVNGSDIVLVIVFPSGRFIQVPITDHSADPDFNGASKMKDEKIFVSFPQIRQTIGMINLQDFVAWKAGVLQLAELEGILRRVKSRRDLPPLR